MLYLNPGFVNVKFTRAITIYATYFSLSDVAFSCSRSAMGITCEICPMFTIKKWFWCVWLYIWTNFTRCFGFSIVNFKQINVVQDYFNANLLSQNLQSKIKLNLSLIHFYVWLNKTSWNCFFPPLTFFRIYLKFSDFWWSYCIFSINRWHFQSFRISGDIIYSAVSEANVEANVSVYTKCMHSIFVGKIRSKTLKLSV